MLCVVASGFLFLVLFIRSQTTWKRAPRHHRRTVAFFHPHASNGGGGERVLWVMLEALMLGNEKRDPALRSRYIIYHAAPAPLWSNLSAKVREQFGVTMPGECEIIGVSQTHLVEPSRYPRLTMVFQAVGSVRLAWECLLKHCPVYFVDTTGFPFSYPLAWLAGCTVISYTHYPTISTDMLHVVSTRTASVVNNNTIARSRVLTLLKQVYYTAFAGCYSLCGKCVTIAMVNSSGTKAHISTLWRRSDVHLVYPPTPVEHLARLPLAPPSGRRKPQIISVAQFRPEKQHAMQLRIFAKVCRRAPEVHLVLVGGVRNEGDQERVTGLQTLAAELGVRDRVSFELNCPYPKLLELLQESLIGLHTMQDEHFGISVVEYMAAGCIAVAHNSAGPKMDIVVPTPDVGFLARTEDEYVDAICALVQTTDARWVAGIQMKAREHLAKFSNAVFIGEIQRLLGCAF